MLAHMLSEITPEARLFMIDTGVLFPETLQTWRQFEERFGLPIEVHGRERRPERRGRGEHCCGQAKVDCARARAEGVDAWITGIRREQGPTRAGARKLERDERRGIWKCNPLADWTEKDLWTLHLRARAAVQPAARSGLRLDRLRALHPPGRAAARAAGQARTRPSAVSTSEPLASEPERALPMSYELPTSRPSRPSRSSSCVRSPPSSSGRCCCSAAARTRSCCCASPRRRSGPARFPFPVMHVDTGHNFPEVIEFRDRLRRTARRAADRRERPGLDRRRPRP